jgi:hypothetical protein
MINGNAPLPDGRTPVKIEMTINEWNQVLALLGEGPFRVVQPLIGKITQQAAAQLVGPPAPPQPPLIEGEGHGLEN